MVTDLLTGSPLASRRVMELDDDVFHLRIIFEGVNAHFPAKATSLIATKWSCSIKDVVTVYPNCSSFEAFRHFMSLVDIFCPNTRGETIFRVITSVDNRIEVFKRCGDDHGAKNFFRNTS